MITLIKIIIPLIIIKTKIVMIKIIIIIKMKKKY